MNCSGPWAAAISSRAGSMPGLLPCLALLRSLVRLAPRLGCVVGAHHFLHQGMAHHVAIRELAEPDALHVLEDLQGVHHSRGLPRREIELGAIPRNLRLGAEAEAGEE